MQHRCMMNPARQKLPRLKRGALVLFVFVACVVGPASGTAEHVLKCVVSIPPLASVVENIGGSRVSVSVLVSGGQDPHTFELTPGQVRTLIDADILFTVGLPFESTIVSRFQGSNNRPRLCDTSQGLKLIEAGHLHREALKGHAEVDRHTWLSPKNLESIAVSIRKAMTSADPGGARIYNEGTAQFIRKLENVNAVNLKALSPLVGKAFTVFHPSFGYFAEAYNLEQRAVETGGKPPTPRELFRLISRSRLQGERVLFVQPQFDQKSAEAIAAAIGADVRTLDPLARDVLANLETIGREISRALSGKTNQLRRQGEKHE